MLCKLKKISLLFLVTLVASANHASAATCNWDLARKNIDWVLFHDNGAKSRYNDARKCGFAVKINGKSLFRRKCLGKYDAVLEAQKHNSHAQLSIKGCLAQSKKYINNRG